MMIDRFYVLSRSGSHTAYLNGGTKILVPSQPTEIDLVRQLNKLGIDLRDYEYHGNRRLDPNNVFSIVVHWTRK